MSIRIERFDGERIVYIALDPDGVWARSEFPDDLITVDYNAQGNIIGIEALGSAAQMGAEALIKALVTGRESVERALEPLAT